MTAPHGSRARYNAREAPCRCEPCRTANARYQALYRATGGSTGLRSRQLSLYDALEDGS